MKRTSRNTDGSALCIHPGINSVSEYLKTFEAVVLPSSL